MTQPTQKYSIIINSIKQACKINSFLEPDFRQISKNTTTIIWYRHPPLPYEVQELTHNFNHLTYQCSSLDYECNIVCRVFGEGNVEVKRFDFGPVEAFLYARLSANLEMRVKVLLFGVWKECVLGLGIAPTLINPQNNNKYQLTQQDIRSIFIKPQPYQNSTSNPQNQPNSQTISIPHTQPKKTIIIENLFQRLILLKLFHQIPNGMYCYSMEVLQMNFEDQSSFNMALLAINRFKYQKRDISDVSKSMYGQMTQQLALTKKLKKSNDSFTQLKAEFYPSGPSKNHSQDTLKKQFLPVSAFTNWRKSPKQSINSANESSIISGNSSKANQSRSSLIPKTLEVTRNIGQNDNNKQCLTSKGSSQYRSRVSIKQPKTSILSTDINSIKQRQQKPSFPENPPPSHTLKSSQLIIKPKEFKSSLSLRRSQEQIKTPRMDIGDQIIESSNPKFSGPVKKKSASDLEVPNEKEQTQEKDQYVNQFENLLFQPGEDDNRETELCLNDSFAKLQEQQENQKLQSINFPYLQMESNRPPCPENILQIAFPPSPTKSQKNILSLKETLKSVLQENYELKQKNENLKKQILQAKSNADKKNDITKYEGEILKMKEIQSLLVKEIEVLKKSTIMSNSQMVDRAKGNNSWINKTIQKQKMSHSFTRPQDGQRSSPYKFASSLFSPPRQSKARPQISFKPTQPSSPSFIARRSQQHDSCSFVVRQAEEHSHQPNSKSIVFNSGELKFMKFQQDPQYQKFRNNQSYSYKQTNSINSEERKGLKGYQNLKY